jgi:glycosyltransferase involved in cell wall biosynthesis
VLVSVGIPFFNGSATLRDAIRSVFAQTLGDWELILVDDGSRDGSLEIARSVRDPRVRVISDGINRGVAHRHNQIAEAARGKYLAKLDDDDVMHPERLQRQVQYMDANPEVDVVATSVYTIDLNGRISGLRVADNSGLTHRNVVAKGMMIQPTMLGRTGWFQRNRYDTGYIRAEDHEMWARTFPHSTFRALPEPLTYYREGRTRTMRKYLLSGHSDRRIFLKYGPAAAGWRETLRWMALSYVKTIVYCPLWLCGLNELVLRNSRANVEPGGAAAAQGTLDLVLHTFVQGLPQATAVVVARSERLGNSDRLAF